MIVQPQIAPPVSLPPERSNQEVSSGAGELSDSMSVGEVGVSHIRKKKSRVRDQLMICIKTGICCIIFIGEFNFVKQT